MSRDSRIASIFSPEATAKELKRTPNTYLEYILTNQDLVGKHS